MITCKSPCSRALDEAPLTIDEHDIQLRLIWVVRLSFEQWMCCILPSAQSFSEPLGDLVCPFSYIRLSVSCLLSIFYVHVGGSLTCDKMVIFSSIPVFLRLCIWLMVTNYEHYQHAKLTRYKCGWCLCLWLTNLLWVMEENMAHKKYGSFKETIFLPLPMFIPIVQFVLFSWLNILPKHGLIWF